MPRAIRTVALSLLTLLCCIVPFSAGPAEVDYAVPASFLLPWDCGRGYRVTWEPEDHWAHGKAGGIAWDFALPQGTPLYAPADGIAHFLTDERPFETNLGYYAEIVTAGGNWLIRMAHLRDAQSGERPVMAGDFIGYSGSSGATAAHLHLELLVRDGPRWVRPDLGYVEHLFGRPTGEYAIGTIITHDGCAARLALSDAIRPAQLRAVHLGDTVELIVPVRNPGSESVGLDAVQVLLGHSSGSSMVAEVRGEWALGAGEGQRIVVPVRPIQAGEWRIQRVLYQVGDVAGGLEAEGLLEIGPSALRVIGVSLPVAEVQVGEAIALSAWVENAGSRDLLVDDLFVSGVRPDGVPWTAWAGAEAVVPAGSVVSLNLLSATIPQTVGEWHLQRIGYRSGDDTLILGQVKQSFAVVGPELYAERLDVYASWHSLGILLRLKNVGTAPAMPDAVEVWGWKADGAQHFSALRSDVTPLAPGESMVMWLGVPLELGEGGWRLVEAGHWTNGHYYPIPVPDHPAIPVALLSGLGADDAGF
jgi:murein DD-endopeptidase MepM/ murein hydrolase activator NlpD